MQKSQVLSRRDPARYRDDPEHSARLNKNHGPEPTRQPRYGNRLYCMVWAEHDLFKVGLSSGRNARDGSAVRTITKYLGYEGAVPGPFIEWRAALPVLEGEAWGDCQRLEMVFATALKQRLGASAARAVGLEWFTRRNLEDVRWKDELTSAAVAAMQFSGLPADVEWEEYTPTHGPSQLDAHRTMRNQRAVCALKDCGVPLPEDSVARGRFRYCSTVHAERDALP